MFPSGLAGVALLLLRLVCALPLVWVSGSGNAFVGLTPTYLVALVLALLALTGTFTPVACSVMLLLALLSLKGWAAPALLSILLHLLTTLSLMMLGPGAYSVDARLFGRRLIVPPQQ